MKRIIDDLIVIKVGTNTLTKNNKLDKTSFESIGEQIDDLRANGHSIVVVTSAGIVSGIELTGSKPKLEGDYDTVDYQRFASLGWQRLLSTWDKHIKTAHVGGLLLTRPELDRTLETSEAMNVIHRLLQHGDVPVINENDAIFHEEITFGDNDRLAAVLAASLIRSPLFGRNVKLVVLSDINGVYENVNDHLSVISEISNIKSYVHVAGESVSGNGKGGMKSKFEAATLATENSIDMWIANGRETNAIARAISGEIGTRFISRA